MAGSDTTVVELFADAQVPELSFGLEQAEARRDVIASVAMLEPRARRVLQLRFGLDGDPPLTYEEIGGLLKMSAETGSRPGVRFDLAGHRVVLREWAAWQRAA